MRTDEAPIAGYFRRMGRRLLATEGPSVTSLSARRAQGALSRAGTPSWRRERQISRFMARHEATVERALNMLPGLIAWSIILIPLLFARRAPIVPVGVALLFQGYWLLRGLGMLIYGGIACARIRVHARIDWRGRYEGEKAKGKRVLPWEDIRHVVIIANYNEPLAKLRTALESLAQQRAVAAHIWVVLAMEAREEGAAEKARTLQQEFDSRLGAVYYTIHPAKLAGEEAVKGANATWAARWARHRLVSELGFNIRHITVTSSDADSVFHLNYFLCLTSKFATDPARYLRLWQAPILFHNNIWQVPTFIRFVSMAMQAGQLYSLVDPRAANLPLSTYSASLALLDSVGYWDPDVISDDWHIFLKSFFHYRGRVSLDPIYLPVSADAPLSHGGLLQTAINRYEQAKRHAWGASDLSYAIRMYFQHAEMPVNVKLPLVWKVGQEHIMWSTTWFVVTLGFLVPSLLNPAFIASPSGLMLGKLLAIVGAAATVLSTAMPLMDAVLAPPRPPERKWWQHIWTCLQWPLLPVIMLLFLVLPSLDAQTRLMLGQKLNFRVTEKA